MNTHVNHKHVKTGSKQCWALATENQTQTYYQTKSNIQVIYHVNITAKIDSIYYWISINFSHSVVQVSQKMRKHPLYYDRYSCSHKINIELQTVRCQYSTYNNLTQVTDQQNLTEKPQTMRKPTWTKGADASTRLQVYLQPHVTLNLEHLTTEPAVSCSFPMDYCANSHQNCLSCFQKHIAFTSLVTDERTDGLMDRQRTLTTPCLCLPVWPSGGIKVKCRRKHKQIERGNRIHVSSKTKQWMKKISFKFVCQLHPCS